MTPKEYQENSGSRKNYSLAIATVDGESEIEELIRSEQALRLQKRHASASDHSDNTFV